MKKPGPIHSTLLFVLSGLLLCQLTGCGKSGQPICITVANPTSLIRNDEGIAISLGKLPPEILSKGFVLRNTSGREIPFQLDDLNGDGRPDELFFQVSLGPYETLSCLCYIGEKQAGPFIKRADAWLLKQVEPGLLGAVWEGEWLAYGCFGPQALHVYGKTKPGLLGHGVIAKDGNSTANGGARDYLHVGLGMGAGSVFLDKGMEPPVIERPFANQVDTDYQLLASGPLRALVDVKLKNWKTPSGIIDLLERMEIQAGQRYLKCEYRTSRWEETGKPLRFGVGIAPLPGQERSRLFDNRFVLTTQGPVIMENSQQPAGGFLASAVIFKPHEFVRAVPSSIRGEDHLLYLRKPDSPLVVYFLHAWDRDGRFTSAAEWQGYTAQLAERMNNPLEFWVSR